MAFDAGEIQARLTVDKADFQRGLDQAKADGDKFARADYTAKLGVADAEAKAKIAQVQARIDRLNAVIARPAVGLDAQKAYAQLDQLNAKLDELGRKAPTAKVKADIAAAKAKIDELNAKLDKLEARDVEVKVKASADLLRAQSDLQKLVAGLDRAKVSSDSLGKSFADSMSKVPLLVSGITAALPAAISLTGVLGGAVIGVGGAFASAGLAAVAFGAVAKPMFTATEAAITRVKAAQLALAKASTPAARIAALKAEKTAMDGLTPSEVKLYGAVKDLQGEWKQLNTTLQPEVWRALQPYLATASSSMGLLATVVKPASGAIRDIGQNLQLLMSSTTTQQFAQFLGTTGSQSLDAGGSFLVNVLKTVMELMPQFQPLISAADRAIVKIGDDMAAWAGSAGAKNGIQSFMQWVRDNGPVVTTLLKNAGAAITNLVSGFAQGGGVGELKLISGFFGLVSRLPKSWVGPVVELASTLALISKFGFGRKLISVAVNWAGAGAAELIKLITGGKVDLSGKFGSSGMQKAADTMVTAAEAMQKAADTMAGADAEGGVAGAAGGAASKEGEAAAGAEGAAAGSGFLKSLKISSLGVGLASAFLLAATKIKIPGTGGKTAWSLGDAPPQDKTFWSQFMAGFSTNRAAGATAGNSLAIDLQDIFSPGFVHRAQDAAIAAIGGKGVQGATDARKLGLGGGPKSLPPGLPASGPAQLANAKAIAQMYGVTLPQAYKLAANAGVDLTKSWETQGTAANEARARVAAEADVLGLMPGRSGAATKAMTAYSSSLRQNGSASSVTIAARHQLITDLENAGVHSQQATALVGKLSAGITDNASSISVTHPTRKGLIDDLTASGLKASTARGDVDTYTTAVRDNGTDSANTRGARAQLIKDLENAGVQAGTARTIVRNLTKSLINIPKNEHVQITVNGKGNYTVQQLGLGATGKGSKPLPSPLPAPNAEGGLITGGTPGRDSVLASLMPGEVVVPTKMVAAGAVDHLRGRLPGFASGGVVGAYSGSAQGLGPWAASEVSRTLTTLEGAVAGATAAAAKSAEAAASIAGATTSAIGDLPANWRAIASFLTGHGYSHAGASGIAGNILQESGGNPESVGDGGGGLIGFTPLPGGYVTGNPGRDLATQLNAVLAYNNRNGNIGTLNAQPTPAAAASYYMSVFERPAVATENAQRREAGANAVFKAMGYAGGSKGAAPGWAKVGERGEELVHFSGGETVLPNSVTSRVLSGTLNLPGYAKGTGKIKDPNPLSGFDAAQRKADEAKLAKFEKQLAAMEKTAARHVTSLRVPIDRDELYLLEHPDLPKAKKAALEKQLSAREAALAKYRKGVTGDEGRLSREIALLRKIIATEPAAPAPPPGTGPLPPGIGKGTKAQNLAELARYVAQLAALKKKAAAELAKLNIPVEQDELYLLQHPDLPASKKAAVEAALAAAKKKVAAYRKTTGAQETTLSDEITILRSLTGEPAGTKYGGAAPPAGGGTSSGPPPGQFVGTLPAPPGEGGALPSGGGTGGLGGSGDSGSGSGAGSSPGGGIMSPLGLGPSSAGWSAPGSVPGALPGGSFSLGAPGGPAMTPGAYQGAFPGQPVGPAVMSGSNVEKLLSQLLAATRGAPAQTGGHLAAALNGTARIASGAGRWNAG